MRLKTDACKKALIRGGFKTTSSPRWLRLGGDNPGEAYDAWLPFEDEYYGDGFVAIYKGTVAASKANWKSWDLSNKIIIRLV